MSASDKPLELPKISKEIGTHHPINIVKDEIEQFLSSLGFSIVLGPEIETEENNFDLLNINEYHPARQMHDTFYVENKKRFIDEFSESEHNVVKLGLITIYYDFISYFDDKEYKVISKNAMNWVENSKDWMILAQGLKLLEKLSNSDEILKSNVISIARQLKNDERKAVRSQAQKILKDT